MFMKPLMYTRHYAQHFSKYFLLTHTSHGEVFIQQVQPTSESEWKCKEKELICLLISLRIIKRPSNLMWYSHWNYSRNGPSGTIIAFIPIDMYHQEE